MKVSVAELTCQIGKTILHQWDKIHPVRTMKELGQPSDWEMFGMTLLTITLGPYTHWFLRERLV